MENERLRKENEKLTAELTARKPRLKWRESTRALGVALRERGLRREAAQVIDVAVTELEPFTSVKGRASCSGNHGRRCTASAIRNRPRRRRAGPRAPHPAALTGAEQAALLAVLDSERFADKSPAQVYAILLDDGIYLASIRTMYRVMTLADQVRERRAQAAIRPGPPRAGR